MIIGGMPRFQPKGHGLLRLPLLDLQFSRFLVQDYCINSHFCSKGPIGKAGTVLYIVTRNNPLKTGQMCRGGSGDDARLVQGSSLKGQQVF